MTLVLSGAVVLIQ